MITLAGWKIIGITLIATFFISAIVYGIMCEIVAKMKNKAQKRTSKQVTCQRHKKTFNPANFISNYNEFIAENTKSMSLFEIKEFIRSVDLEIYSLVMKGVR